MNRRGFLGRLVIGAAAVLGVGSVKVAEASEESLWESETAARRQGLRREYGEHIQFSQPGPLRLPSLHATKIWPMHVSSGYSTWGTPGYWRLTDAPIFGSELQRVGTVTWNGAGCAIQFGPGTYQMSSVDLRGKSNITIRGADDEQTIITHPPTELTNHCLTCDWVGSWSTMETDQQIRDGLSEFHNHVMYKHDGSLTAMGNRDTVWRPVHPPTFETMAADCAGLGCRMTKEPDPTLVAEHFQAVPGGYHWAYFGHWASDHGIESSMTQIDSWRRSLHERTA